MLLFKARAMRRGFFRGANHLLEEPRRRRLQREYVMNQHSFFIDFDEDPELGGQQGFFFIGEQLSAAQLRGGRILGFHLNEKRQLVLTVALPSRLDQPADAESAEKVDVRDVVDRMRAWRKASGPTLGEGLTVRELVEEGRRY